MNIFTALMLSTKKQACLSISQKTLLGLFSWDTYEIRVVTIPFPCGPETYIVTVFRVTYPEQGSGRHVAEEPHFVQECEDKAALIAFLNEHQFSLEDWSPFEEPERGADQQSTAQDATPLINTDSNVEPGSKRTTLYVLVNPEDYDRLITMAPKEMYAEIAKMPEEFED